MNTSDAVCRFNPIYGQGMLVAFDRSEALDECLAKGIADLAKRFYARARKIVDILWLIDTGEDLRSPRVEGPRPAGSWLVNRFSIVCMQLPRMTQRCAASSSVSSTCSRRQTR